MLAPRLFESRFSKDLAIVINTSSSVKYTNELVEESKKEKEATIENGSEGNEEVQNAKSKLLANLFTDSEISPPVPSENDYIAVIWLRPRSIYELMTTDGVRFSTTQLDKNVADYLQRQKTELGRLVRGDMVYKISYD